MIYLHLALEHAIAETEARAVALEARGYRRCSYEVHRALWAIETMTRLAALRAISPPAARSQPAPPDNGPAVDAAAPTQAVGGPTIRTRMRLFKH